MVRLLPGTAWREGGVDIDRVGVASHRPLVRVDATRCADDPKGLHHVRGAERQILGALQRVEDGVAEVVDVERVVDRATQRELDPDPG